MKGYRITEDYLLFWGSEFSQWFKTSFKDKENIIFSSAEQFMFYHKAKLFNDQDILKRVLNTSDPRKQKALGRQVKDFSQEIWDSYKEDIVFLGNLYKFTQNKKLLHKMISTPQHFVEASPVDKIWGIGLHYENPLSEKKENWKGENLLGQALDKVKSVIVYRATEEIERIEKRIYNEKDF